MLPCRDSAVCLSVRAVPGFPGTWLPNIYLFLARWHMVAQHTRPHGSLALGCPTLRPRLPCFTLRHRTSLAHGCPSRHLLNSLYIHLRSRWTSFIPAVILCDIYLPSIVYSAAICDTLYTLCTCSGSTLYILCSRYPLRSMNIVIIWPSVLAHLFVRISPCFIPCIPDGYVICQYYM